MHCIKIKCLAHKAHLKALQAQQKLHTRPIPVKTQWLALDFKEKHHHFLTQNWCKKEKLQTFLHKVFFHFRTNSGLNAIPFLIGCGSFSLIKCTTSITLGTKARAFLFKPNTLIAFHKHKVHFTCMAGVQHKACLIGTAVLFTQIFGLHKQQQSK